MKLATLEFATPPSGPNIHVAPHSQTSSAYISREVYTTVILKIVVFYPVTPCSLVAGY
jgi:hypothetical protein